MQERYTFASVLEVFLIVILAMYATVRRLGREIYAGQKVEELYFKALQCNKYSTIWETLRPIIWLKGAHLRILKWLLRAELTFRTVLILQAYAPLDTRITIH